ncbi:uracil-DNA glycosylase [Guyparkeria hydrothermalis]|uniref:uracil-DNA glycosylase n=1 Tax=Guyparkeria hydrothermalis TaxID=923 RepID=UPI0020214C60|nr:uracil-DNA glycosylase [Guyparkeria hydrothermalis]MCL7750968.1 uracil-DNA glycosylase [Guyparkeria hydrothermalis]
MTDSALQRVQMEPAWREALAPVLLDTPMQQLRQRLLEQGKRGTVIHPKPDEWFRAFNHTPLDQVRVVILGQDPYPTPGHANGLCFSVRPDVRPLPKSLLNIFKELADDLGIQNRNGDLTHWADQGVLLLNAVLTVASGQAASHQGMGWEQLTDHAIRVLAEQPRPIVFVFWGAQAQKKAAHVHRPEHLVIKSPHPSPLSAYRGFFGSKPFSRINAFLESHGLEPIDWRTGVESGPESSGI